ncbi:M23 family metallopeptidase [Spirosoma oryzae]|uniref:M23 family metallopeptidase n=1 Tax=Spirosoma oryzae TaxID=1469603 RepID=UPI001472C396|nr:M23 family metallopeptidase [Spirosoma oryzae]
MRLLSDKLAQLRTVTPVVRPNSLLRDTPSILPIRIRSWSEYRISSGFGLRWHPIRGKLLNHAGIDLPQPLNTPVYATADGIVDKIVRQVDGIGLAIYIRHRSGYTSVYGHLAAQLVMPGDIVDRGQPIALVGNSGLSTGPHLPYSVLDRGKPVNPVDFCFLLLRAIQASAAPTSHSYR